LSFSRAGLFFTAVTEKWNRWLPFVFVALVALSRWPGLFPPNFSAATALAFCAGVYLSGAMRWWLPLGTMCVTDVVLNVFYYHTAPVGGYLLLNYVVYAALIRLGQLVGRHASFVKLLAGGLLGAIAFYLITNTLAWLENPVYARTLAGWIQALTSGQPGFPPTWEFFRNTLLSGGLFTALFVGAMKLTAPAESPVEKEAGVRPEQPKDEEEPEEAKV
jgi:multisubunit Na+/H+ antiporter MnhG subunit